mgnify:CR=1 FL=1
MAESSGVVPGPQDSLMEEVVEDSTWRLIGMVWEGVEDNIMLSRVDIGSLVTPQAAGWVSEK